MWNMKVGVSKRAQWGPICEPRQLGIMLLPLLCCQHCLLPTWAKLLNYYGPPLNIKFAISFWRLQTGELFLWGIVENLGQCVGCAQWLILGWARETGAPLRTPPPFSSFNSNQLRQEANSWHYQVDFEKNKSSSALLYTSSGGEKRQTETSSHAQPLIVCLHARI